MAEEELVSGDGWISDDSSFYGDEEEQACLLSLCDHFDPAFFWPRHGKDLNTLLAQTRKMPPPDLHNIYEGKLDAWQLNEPVDDFLQRLPPLTTNLSIGPWIWVANPYPEGRDRSGCAHVQDELVPRGMNLLQQSLQERYNIRAKNSQNTKGTIAHLLNLEGESLKKQLAKLAEETNVVSGKWMLFPALEDLTRVWRVVVEGTISNRLGSAAKVATDQGGSGERLICVYTKDFRDERDVLRVLNELVSLGLVYSGGKGIYYKSDAYTYLDIYAKNAADYGLQASVYSSQKMLAAASVASAN